MHLYNSVQNPELGFMCNSGSQFLQNENSIVTVKNGSSLYLKSGSKYEIKNGAEMIFAPGSHFKMDACSELSIEGTGKLIIQDGVTLEIEDGVVLTFEYGLQNTQIHASVIVPSGYVDPRLILPSSNIISQNSNWSNKTVQISGDFKVTGNSVLNLSNTTIYLNKDISFTVDPGSKCIADNTTFLPNPCLDNRWHGIVLLGTHGQPQTEQYQGVLEIKNGSVIENAETGVYIGNPDSYASNVGGILKVENATFKNCITGIYFQPYRISENNSYIYNSTFETTDYLASVGEIPSEFIYLHDVGIIDIKGNTFINSAPAAYSFNQRGKGIKSIDADFDVDFYCTNFIISPCPEQDMVLNNFENLYKAIDAGNTTSGPAISVNKTLFNTNYYGIYLNNIDEIEITSNTFNTSTQDASLYMTGCNGFHIEDNTFNGQMTVTGYGCQARRGSMKYTGTRLTAQSTALSPCTTILPARAVREPKGDCNCCAIALTTTRIKFT